MRTRRLLYAAAAALLGLVWVSTSPTLSGWPAGRVVNSTNTGAAGSLAFSHSVGSPSCTLGPRATGSVSCSGSLAPSAASATTAVTGTDQITNNGTTTSSRLSRSVSAAACAAVRLDNRVSGRPVLLPRYRMAFQATDKWGGTNAVTLDGASYAASVAQDTELPTLGTYGMGVWFKAGSGQSGPLFGLDGSPVNAATSGGDDRTLYLRANGTLGFAYTSNGLTLSSATTYADGAWHFAYVTIIVAAATSTVALSVDGTTIASAGITLGTRIAGYWHLGWGSTALTGLSTGFFTGSLSNLVIFNGANAPAAVTAANLASQSTFTTWAANATDHWLLGDTGTTTYGGAQPVIGTTSPCTMLDIAWSFASPSATAVTTSQLSAFANGVARPVSASPDPTSTQTGTVTITRDATYNAYVAGLRLYVPFTEKVSATGGAWPITFTWASAASVVIA